MDRILCTLVVSIAFILAMISHCPSVYADKDTLVNSLQRSGIKYPDGFDVNTVGEVRGTVSDLYVPDKGPVQLVLSNRFDRYIVILAPKWYVQDIELHIQTGQEIKVKGSKGLGRDGNLYILAEEVTLTNNGRSFPLRTQTGTPLWTGSGSQRGSGGLFRGQGHGGQRGGMGGQGRR